MIQKGLEKEVREKEITFPQKVFISRIINIPPYIQPPSLTNNVKKISLSFPNKGKNDPKRFGKGSAREGNNLSSKGFSFSH